MTSKLFLILVSLCGAALAVFLVYAGGCALTQCDSVPFVLPQVMDSFEDCVKAGYPVTGLNTQRCTLPSGRVFTKVGVDSSSSSVNVSSFSSASSITSSAASVSSAVSSSMSKSSKAVSSAPSGSVIKVTAPVNGAVIGRKLVVQGTTTVVAKTNLLFRLRDGNGNTLAEGTVSPGTDGSFMINEEYLAPATKTGTLELFTGSTASPKNVTTLAVMFPSL